VAPAAVPARLAATQATDASVASDALQQQVGQLLSKHFHYPRLARMRGWEGIVELGMHIAADGRVSNIILHRRSAYPTLDRAALLAAGQLRSVPGADALLDQDGLELVVPVHYRLIDS
jgi:protein TonB